MHGHQDIGKWSHFQRSDTCKYYLEEAADTRSSEDTGAPESQYDASWEQLPSEQRTSAISNVDVYLDNFISIVHGGPK